MNRSNGSRELGGSATAAWNSPMMSRTSALVLSLLFLLVSSVAIADPAPNSDAKPIGSTATVSSAAPVEPQASFIERAQQHIEAREYWASEGTSGLQAPNRRHNLRTYFGSDGIRVLDRTAAGSPELLSMKLRSMGRKDALKPVGPGEVTSVDARVEIRRDAIVEWYVNRPSGLEQGFNLAKKPAGDGAIVLELALTGATARQAGDSLRLMTKSGRLLDYSKLVAIDAQGNTLPVQMLAASMTAIELHVDDGGAKYPIVIDPLLTSVADTLIPGNQSNVFIGQSVSDAGDVNGDGFADIIMGAPGYDIGQADEGAAFIALGTPSGTSVTLITGVQSNQVGAGLGESVSGAGDLNGDGYDDVIIGAPGYDDVGLYGAVFVFHGSASGIPDGDPTTADGLIDSSSSGICFCDGLGLSVSGAGDVDGDGFSDVIVGVEGFDTNRGRAFVFHGGPSGVGTQDVSTADTEIDLAGSGSGLGKSVSGAGDVNGDGYADVIIGASGYNGGAGGAGAAFVFHGSASGIADGSEFFAAAQLQSAQLNAHLGESVAGAGDVNGDGYSDVIVGAPDWNLSVGGVDQGLALVFHGSATGVITSGNPGNADAVFEGAGANSERLGAGVSGAGDVNGDGYADVIIGSPGYTEVSGADGAAFVYLGGADGVDDVAAFDFMGGQAIANVGASVSGAGDVNGDGYADVVIGAPLYDANFSNDGAVFVLHGGATGIVDGDFTTADTQLDSNQSSDALAGWQVSGAGDVNGDGYADVIIGADTYDGGFNDGAAFVFLGGASGIADGGPAAAATELNGIQFGSRFGASVSGAGDVNGDGYADVIVGAWSYDSGESNEGAAFVFPGSASGIADGNPGTASALLQSNQADAFWGTSVSGAGDVNGDGYADVIVGARDYTAGELEKGAAFVFLGSASGIANGNAGTASAQLESNDNFSDFGTSVSGAGDVNGDGYADVIVGAEFGGAAAGGAAFVFLGSASGVASGNPSTASAQLESNLGSALFGSSVSGAGDVNGDGYADVIVGADGYDGVNLEGGAAFVFLGSASGIATGDSTTAATQIDGTQATEAFGASVAGVGDVNGDGYADVVVGALDFGPGVSGASFVFLGSASGVANGNPATASAQLTSNSGRSVSGAGDVNGDGYADVIVGSLAPNSRAAIFLGNSEGRLVSVQQRVDDGSGQPIQPWGRSNDPDSFEVGMTATHPDGRGRVKLETELCLSGVAFGDAQCESFESASWVDVTATAGGVLLTESIAPASAAPSLEYRWRSRVLYAPFRVTEAGILEPPNPSHGPWRRISGQEEEADVRLVPEPGAALSLLSGVALLAALARRRRDVVS